ncbi:hypothetical protein SeLEV6574_g01897 [Synchytrium endobioticum]|nr:hypothetical protein SeLEV6574_g01897 [Synchytrium endobioticum]
MYIRDYAARPFRFDRNWRCTYAHAYRHILPSSKPLVLAPTPLKLRGMFSDILYTPHLYSSIPLSAICGIATETVDRRADLSVSHFVTEYGIPNKPVILTAVVPHWPAFVKWDLPYLQRKCGDRLLRAEAIHLTMHDYLHYSQQCHEESPLYLFDKHVAHSLVDDYTVPPPFADDMLLLLADKRPDHTWLIVGPARSGSTFHVDPNCTSAYNAVIRGAKKWLLYPPGTIPPGVFVSDDGSEVTSPLSVTEWFVNFYTQAINSAVKPLECVCRAGEVLFVPHGWFHLVINLEPSIAITSNFTPSYSLPTVLRWLKDRPDQVSGYRGHDLYSDFVDAVKRKRPDLLPFHTSTNHGTAPLTSHHDDNTWQSSDSTRQFKFDFSNPDHTDD